MTTEVASYNFPSTHQSLLARLKGDSDQTAWSEFVKRYGLIVYRWCSHRIDNKELAQEVSIDLLIDLPRRLKKYQYRGEPGKFRGWLHAVVINACTDLLRRRKNEQAILSRLLRPDAIEELEKYLNQLLDQEVYDVAWENVSKRVNTHPSGNPKTLEAYRLTAPSGFFRGEGLTNEEAAVRLGVDITFVEKARSNVKKMLTEEIQRIENE